MKREREEREVGEKMKKRKSEEVKGRDKKRTDINFQLGRTF